MTFFNDFERLQFWAHRETFKCDCGHVRRNKKFSNIFFPGNALLQEKIPHTQF